MFIPDPGSGFFPSRILDPDFFHPGSRCQKEHLIRIRKNCIPVIEKKHAPQRQRSSRKFTETPAICRDRLTDPKPITLISLLELYYSTQYKEFEKWACRYQFPTASCLWGKKEA
jgi:hypothetical protein